LQSQAAEESSAVTPMPALALAELPTQEEAAPIHEAEILDLEPAAMVAPAEDAEALPA